MISAKEAVEFAKQHAIVMLGKATTRLEEIERDEYKGRDVWRITLGYPPDQSLPTSLRTLGMGNLEYKVFLIDSGDGELVAMKLREPVLP